MIEEHLVRAAQRGDTVAMNELLDALTPYVGKICGPIALNDGPDAAQEGARGQRARLEGQLRPGWCWLQSRFLIIGMAVAAEPGGGTRVALTGGIRVPGRAAIVPIRVRQESSKTLGRLQQLLRDRGQ